MKISELIVQLIAIHATEGDIDVIHRQGEFDDLYPVDGPEVIEVDKGGSERWPDYSEPRHGRVANAKAVELS